MSWISDSSHFKRELTEGFQYQEGLLIQLWCEGLDIDYNNLEFRKNFADRKRFQNEKDAVVNGHRLEIKSRRLSFNSVTDYPFDTIIVDTVKKWNLREPKPIALALISRPTKSVIAIPASTESEWHMIDRVDKVRGFDEQFYVAPKECAISYKGLVRLLNGQA
jgi:hypothetical protein